MNRFARIRTIWRKELVDTLRDRRTLIAMIFVPLVLYPAMMLGSLQGFELQVSRLKQEEYKVAVVSERDRAWLQRLIDEDPARHPGSAGQPAEVLVEKAVKGELDEAAETQPAPQRQSAAEAARSDVRQQPPSYDVRIVADPKLLKERVANGSMHVGLLVSQTLPTAESHGTAEVVLVLDQTDIRSQIAASGLDGILQRAGDSLLLQRLKRVDLDPEFIRPMDVRQEAIATPEKVGGSILGQIVPLILIVMTITGAIYPAIDLTAGERERGTLETLMVAPVPTVDLIAGKFVVVALIAMISAALNLLSIGGTIYLGGLGNLLTQGGAVVIPLHSLPLVLLVLIPLAVMFSAVLLAVCSFARSFKEAQNYVMPVMVAALIPAVVGVLPGTRLEGPLLIMPVTNIVILTRDLFMDRIDIFAVLWVTLSTTLYAGAAVAVATKLFGQEAVLFADSGSIKTIFQRRFFKPVSTPTAAQAAFLLALVFSVNFFVQQALLTSAGIAGTMWFWWGIAVVLVVLFALFPVAAALYMRVRIKSAFGFSRPAPLALVAAVCFGLSTWIVAQAWFAFQQSWLPIPPEMERAFQAMEGILVAVGPWAAFFFLGLVPGICEELFFRGYVLSGLRGGLGKWASVLVVGIAFGVYHHSVHRLIIASALGIVFGLLVIQYRSIWPAILAHLMHNALLVLSGRADALKPLLARLGYVLPDSGMPPVPWLVGAAVLVIIGVLICVLGPRRGEDQRAATLAISPGGCS